MVETERKPFVLCFGDKTISLASYLH